MHGSHETSDDAPMLPIGISSLLRVGSYAAGEAVVVVRLPLWILGRLPLGVDPAALVAHLSGLDGLAGGAAWRRADRIGVRNRSVRDGGGTGAAVHVGRVVRGAPPEPLPAPRVAAPLAVAPADPLHMQMMGVPEGTGGGDAR